MNACTACKGEGKQLPFPADPACPRCHGSGQEPATCPTCNSNDRDVLLGECADRSTRYGGASPVTRVHLRLVDPWHVRADEIDDLKDKLARANDAVAEANLNRYERQSYG
jgi:hypothetical protein